MSEPANPKKKKNKKKKKPLTEVNNETSDTSKNIKDDSKNAPLTINEVLPHQVGMKTVFNDVEVTMTHSGSTNEVVNSTSSSKKKKKKKKSKQQSENIEEVESSETDNKNFIKFGDDHIELVNHPEISVTIADPVETSEKKEPAKTEEKNSAVPDKEEENTASSSKKKKKKRKKKKNNTEPIQPEEEKSDPNEAGYTAPTYVKLPAAGDNCVLLVSHESFSNNNKVPVTSSETVTITSNSNTVLVKRKDLVDQPRETTSNPVPHPQASVSIFPVMQNANSEVTEKNADFNMNTSLQKVSDMVNDKINSNETANSDVTGSSQEPAPTKAQLKAERRAKQEAQRAAKLAKSTVSEVTSAQVAADSTKDTPKAPPTVKESTKKQDTQDGEQAISKSAAKVAKEKVVASKSQIFSHLPQWKNDSVKRLNDASWKIHPAIIELGSHYMNGLRGSNARCVGFLAAFRDVVMDYKLLPNKELTKDLESKLSSYLKFLDGCRPLSVSVSNCVRFLKHQISHLPRDISLEEAKHSLCVSINNFVNEEILLANEAICIATSAKIVHGDNILVFAYSSLVKDALCKAHDQNKKFQVLVADSRHNSEGNEMVRRLREHGLQCSYVPSGSVSIIMKTISKVVIGAHALLSNGSVMSRAGCKEMALFASYYNVPVLVCCETYKFCERALTDSCVHNELGRPEDLIQSSIDGNESLRNCESLPSLQMYNILYDVTPSDLISVVITEKGFLPTTSVPVVLRVKHAGWQE